MKKTDQNEAIESEKIYNDYPGKRTEIMKNTPIQVGDTFGVILRKEGILSEQISKPNSFWPKYRRNQF